MPKLFLYLASRRKDGIKLVAILSGPPTILSRVTDPGRLHLPTSWDLQVRRILDTNRMLYEPWIESADSYQDLRDRLIGRGYTNIPAGLTPLLSLTGPVPKANTSGCGVRRSMIGRNRP